MKTFNIDLEFVADDGCGSIQIVDSYTRKTKKAALKLMESLSLQTSIPDHILKGFPEGGRLRVWATCYDEYNYQTTHQWEWENGECVYETEL